jgi:hypothetical protein
MDGRFDEVADHANRFVAIIPTDPNFRLSFAAQMGQVGLECGRAADLLPMIQAAQAITPDLPAMRASMGGFLLATGEPEQALAAIVPVIEHWTECTREWTWTLTMARTAEVIAETAAVQYARVVADELSLFTGQLCLTGTAVLCVGALDRYRGMLLTLLGEHDEAVAAIEAGLELEQSIKAPPLVARSRYWLARALLPRGRAGDAERAGDELTASIATSDELGMVQLADEGRALLATLG